MFTAFLLYLFSSITSHYSSNRHKKRDPVGVCGFLSAGEIPFIFVLFSSPPPPLQSCCIDRTRGPAASAAKTFGQPEGRPFARSCVRSLAGFPILQFPEPPKANAGRVRASVRVRPVGFGLLE